MIKVYFVQHAKALPKDVDKNRAVTGLGIDETLKVAKTLKSRGVFIHKIFHSGKLRAAQTADLFADVLEVNVVSELNGMNPNDSVEEFIKQIREDAVMYIGHLPHIQKLSSSLIAGNENANALLFQNSSVACIEIGDINNSLKWFITADLCE